MVTGTVLTDDRSNISKKTLCCYSLMELSTAWTTDDI